MLWQFEDSTCPTISPVAICRANQRRPAFIRHTCPTKQKVIPAFPKKNFNLNPVLRIRILPDSSLSDLIQIFFLPEPHLNVFESFCADFHPASPCSNYFALSRYDHWFVQNIAIQYKESPKHSCIKTSFLFKAVFRIWIQKVKKPRKCTGSLGD